MDHVCLSYKFKNLISSYSKLFSCSNIHDPINIKFLLEIKNIIIDPPLNFIIIGLQKL